MLQVERGTMDRMVAQLVDIGSLRKAAEVARAASAQPDLVAETAALVSEGDALFAGQDYARAREKYLSALARIPAVQSGYTRLSEIDRVNGESVARAVGSALAAGDEAYAAGDFDAAVERYGTAFQMLQVDPGAAGGLVDRLIDIGSQRRASAMAAAAQATPAGVPPAPDPQAEARARSSAWLEALRARLATAGASPAQVSTTGDTLVALLETKLLVQKTLLSPEVATRHPDLYDRLERYLQALADEARADAQLAILRDLDSLLAQAEVAEPEAAAQPDALAGRYPAAEQRSILERILERLQALLR